MNIHTLTIVGVGLIGGSIALAARQRGLARRVLGVDCQPATLDEAQALGVIDEGVRDLATAARRSALMVFCTPVDAIPAQVLAAAEACTPGTLLTDAGSTKAAIVRELDGRVPAHVTFIGSHPLAGSEKRGPRYADAHLFSNRVAVLTPTPQTDPAALVRLQAFWQGLGSRVRIMPADEHDRALALTSHLPHLVASALCGVLPAGLRELAATGFRDTTRIAAGDPSIWTGIFAQNRDALLAALPLLVGQLQAYREALLADDRTAVDALLTQAKRTRDALGS
ncbi:MAG: prephenate dehydrogenase/arogenate dehydrogenase family protein [Planctomycetia bacterium]|nr:prephenate dehydrogenase/arogenate dehydrogenase family protein [Planctomycetia bacterium]